MTEKKRQTWYTKRDHDAICYIVLISQLVDYVAEDRGLSEGQQLLLCLALIVVTVLPGRFLPEGRT